MEQQSTHDHRRLIENFSHGADNSGYGRSTESADTARSSDSGSGRRESYSYDFDKANSRLVVAARQSGEYTECGGLRYRHIGEKCFALIVTVLVSGILLSVLGTTCLIYVNQKSEHDFCDAIGGSVTALLSVCGGGALLLFGILCCILIHECSGKELHGGKCHINCHVFEDLVV